MSFLKSVAVLVSGTALGHGITAAALPVLSRLYTPADFSLLAVFAGLVSIISVAACLRFDVAIALPEHDHEALSLLTLAMGIAGTVALVLLAVALTAPVAVAEVINQPALAAYLWLVPISVFLAGGYSALQMWFVRQKQFPLIARSRVTQSAGAAGVQIGSGALGVGASGLLFGHAMNTGAACLVLGYTLLRNKHNRSAIRSATVASLRTTFKKFDKFPKYSTWEALSNAASIQVPILLIAALAPAEEAGYLTMANYVMQAPMALIGTAIGQVYLSRSPEEFRQGTLFAFTKRILKGLLRTGVAPLLVIGFAAPFAFGIALGENWTRAGTLVLWMTPWFILQFLTAPISMSLHVTNNQKTAFALQLGGLLFRAGTVLAFAKVHPQFISEAYAASGLIFYSAYLCTVLFIVKKSSATAPQCIS